MTLEKWEKEKETRKLVVGENEVADVVAGWTKIPVKKLAQEESERLKNLEGILHERGQNSGSIHQDLPDEQELPSFSSSVPGQTAAFCPDTYTLRR